MQNLILLLLLLVLQTVVAVPRYNYCYMDVQPGQCNNKIKMWYYNKNEMRCLPFFYTGCGGNANSFASRLKCEGTCGNICQQPVQSGLCDAFVSRFAYNARKGRCERFKYSGCGGNRNNFQTLKKCRKVCESRCLLPAKTGPCKAMMRRYFFNAKTKTCEMFIYGGCSANANNFQTKKACEATCLSSYMRGWCDFDFMYISIFFNRMYTFFY